MLNSVYLMRTKSTPDVNARIQRVTEDLRAIQHELNWTAIESPTDPEQKELLKELAPLESLQTLKSVLDQMRHFLWFYFQVLRNESDLGERLRQALQPQSSQEANEADLARIYAADRAFWRYRLKGRKPN